MIPSLCACADCDHQEDDHHIHGEQGMVCSLPGCRCKSYRAPRVVYVPTVVKV